MADGIQCAADHFLRFRALQNIAGGIEKGLALAGQRAFKGSRGGMSCGEIVGQRFADFLVLRMRGKRQRQLPGRHFQKRDVVGIAAPAPFPHGFQAVRGDGFGMDQHGNGVNDAEVIVLQERQVLDQKIGQHAPHRPACNGVAAEHQAGVFDGRQGPPGMAGQFVGETGRVHDGDDGFRFAGEQEFAQIDTGHLTMPGPARQKDRIAAGRTERMAGQQLAHLSQVFVLATIGRQRNAGLALVGQRVQRQR